MNSAELLLIGSVAAVGVFHTMVPDHWLPIAVMARQQQWSRGQIARTAFQAGAGHVVSTLVIAVVFWVAGAMVAARFGQWIETATSLALIGFGLWVAIGAIREMRQHLLPDHEHKTGSRMALLLILGSSPMIEGIPAFFAAGQYGIGLLVIMALVFAAATIATYIAFSVFSASGAQKLHFGRFEQYGEIASGLIIVGVGVVFWIWPVG
ncbi:MAG: hypothetical protein ACREDL_06105 [Bradyrhizobium sp.]